MAFMAIFRGLGFVILHTFGGLGSQYSNSGRTLEGETLNPKPRSSYKGSHELCRRRVLGLEFRA